MGEGGKGGGKPWGVLRVSWFWLFQQAHDDRVPAQRVPASGQSRRSFARRPQGRDGAGGAMAWSRRSASCSSRALDTSEVRKPSARLTGRSRGGGCSRYSPGARAIRRDSRRAGGRQGAPSVVRLSTDVA